VNRLREYRQRYGLTQEEAAREILRRAVERGDPVLPALDQPALSRHENGHTRPGPRARALYCDLFGATPAELGFRVALPARKSDDEDVNRREFLSGATGLAASAALPPLPASRLGHIDIARLRESMNGLDKLGDQLGGARAVYQLTVRLFDRLRGLTERSSYKPATGRALRELAGLTADNAGWLAFDAGRQDDARRWWLEAMHWARFAESDSVSVVVMAALARQASDQGRPREVIDLAVMAQRTAGPTATPRLMSVLFGREALGHAGVGDAPSAHAALRRARSLASRARDDGEPTWLDLHKPGGLASHEHRAALMLGDLAAAEDAARTTLAQTDPITYPRNRALDLVNLADVLARRGEVDESVAFATQAAVAAADLDSGRVTRGLRDLAKRLEPHRDNPDVGAFLALL
jgi:transcriptional regulator with XRE-family HTH domain